MPDYKCHIPGGDVETQYTLELKDDGTFSMSYSVWDAAAGGGGICACGRWTRAGDTITFELTEKPMD
jgi:hypothetical protein